MHVEELMSKPALKILDHDPLNLAAQLMSENDCGLLTVVDDQGHLVGLLTDRDVCMAAWKKDCVIGLIHVADAMSTDVFSVRADQETSDAERLMEEHHVRRVPVVDEYHRPIGVLSVSDIAREAARPESRLREGLSRAMERLSAILQPRRRAEAE